MSHRAVGELLVFKLQSAGQCIHGLTPKFNGYTATFHIFQKFYFLLICICYPSF